MDLVVSEEVILTEEGIEPDCCSSSDEDHNTSSLDVPLPLNIPDNRYDHAYARKFAPVCVNFVNTNDVDVPYFDMLLSEDDSDCKPAKAVRMKKKKKKKTTGKRLKKKAAKDRAAKARATKDAKAPVLLLQTLSDDGDEIQDISKQNKESLQGIKSEIIMEDDGLAQVGGTCTDSVTSFGVKLLPNDCEFAEEVTTMKTKVIRPSPSAASGRSRRRAAEAAMLLIQTLSGDDDDDDDDEVHDIISKQNKQSLQAIKSEIIWEDDGLIQDGGTGNDFATSCGVNLLPVEIAEGDVALTIVKQEIVEPDVSFEQVSVEPDGMPDNINSTNCQLATECASYNDVKAENSDYAPSVEPPAKKRKPKPSIQKPSRKAQSDNDSDYMPDEDNIDIDEDYEDEEASSSSWEHESKHENEDEDGGSSYIRTIGYQDCICEVCKMHHSNRSQCKLYDADLTAFPNKTGSNGETLFDSASLPEVLELVPNADGKSSMVVAKEPILEFTLFGPLVGEEILIYSIEPDSTLEDLWVVVDDEDKVTCISTARDDNSNWARYLTPAKSFKKANIMAISKEKKMYFVTIGAIEPQEPLMVWQDEHVGLALWTKRQHKHFLKPDSCFRTRVTYRTNFHLRMHFMMYHDLRLDGCPTRHNYFCHVCNESVFTAAELVDHCYELHGQRPWKCGLCHKLLKWAFLARNHHKHCTKNPDAARYCCEFCGKEFRHYNTLKRHNERVHEGIRRNTCEYCGKQLSTEGGLSRHISDVHHKGQLYVCDKCGKRFSQNTNLKVHLLTHSGKKPFECAEEGCTTAYTTKQCLQLHYRRVHKYTDEDMPEIYRTVAFTFEDHATRCEKSPDPHKEIAPKQRRNRSSSKESTKKTAPKQRRDRSSSKESTKETAPKQRRDRSSSKESTKKTAPKQRRDRSSSKESTKKTAPKQRRDLSSSKESTKETAPKQRRDRSSSKESTKKTAPKQRRDLSSSKESTKETAPKQRRDLSSSKESTKKTAPKQRRDLSSSKESTKETAPKQMRDRSSSKESTKKTAPKQRRDCSSSKESTKQMQPNRKRRKVQQKSYCSGKNNDSKSQSVSKRIPRHRNANKPTKTKACNRSQNI